MKTHRALLVYGSGRTEWDDTCVGAHYWHIREGNMVRVFKMNRALDQGAPVGEDGYRPRTLVYLEVLPEQVQP